MGARRPDSRQRGGRPDTYNRTKEGAKKLVWSRGYAKGAAPTAVPEQEQKLCNENAPGGDGTRPREIKKRSLAKEGPKHTAQELGKGTEKNTIRGPISREGGNREPPYGIKEGSSGVEPKKHQAGPGV